jgi:hypothetical protein
MRSCLLCLFLLASALGRPHFENHHNHNSSAHFETHHNSSSPFFGSHRYPLLVHTSTGRVRGFLRTVGDKEIRVFYGIPYARPPIGDLRFRRPQPVEKWPHVFHADELPNSCYQASIFCCCCCFSVCVCGCRFSPNSLFPLDSAFSELGVALRRTPVALQERAAPTSKRVEQPVFLCSLSLGAFKLWLV